MIYSTKPIFLSSFSLYCLGIIQLVKFLSIVSITTANIAVLAVGIICLIHVTLKHRTEIPTGHVLLFLAAYTAFGIISFFYNGNMDAVELLWPLGYMCIGLLFLNEGIPLKASKIVFILFSCILLVNIVISGNVSSLEGNFSRNMISVYALLFFSLLVLSSHMERQGLSFVYPFIFSILCFSAIGRGGIITGGLCILAFIFFDFSKEHVVKRSIIFFSISIVSFSILAFFVYKFMPEIINTAILNFESRGLESQRRLLWNDYWSKTFGNFFNILFGAEISGTYALDRYSENLHNSFFMLHAKYGALMLIGVFFTIANTIKMGIREKNFHILLVCLLVIFRSNFDYTNFNDCLDCVLIYLLFYYDFLYNKKIIQIKRVSNETKG